MSPKMMQPTVHQQQMFEIWMQQQELEQQMSKKRQCSGGEADAVNPFAKMVRKEPWTPCPTVAATRPESEVDPIDQFLYESVDPIDEFLYELVDPAEEKNVQEVYGRTTQLNA